jgi:DNA (cytosine-5)-methyltransferase 1
VKLTVGSLFAGIGGFDLGLERTGGFEIKFQCEIDPYCQRVLAKHWPDVKRYGDIRELRDVERVDVLCGGFPCQPVSLAGDRLGQEDERWMWPEFARVIRMVRPRYVLVENTPGLLTLGMGDVLGGLSTSGYDAEWGIVSASDVGAPHLRERVWIVAYDASDLRGASWHDGPVALDGRDSNASHGFRQRYFRPEAFTKTTSHEERHDSPYRQERKAITGTALAGREDDADLDAPRLSKPWDPGTARASTARVFKGAAINRDSWWAIEPGLDRVVHGVSDRVDRLKGLGNAVVPQVVEWIGNRILEYEGMTP